MPLVNGGKIVDDGFVKLAVDTQLPEGGDILVPAERFLTDADALLKRKRIYRPDAMINLWEYYVRMLKKHEETN